MKTPPSIFNDVLGPVMRGPSGSHSAAANRGQLTRNLVEEPTRFDLHAGCHLGGRWDDRSVSDRRLRS